MNDIDRRRNITQASIDASGRAPAKAARRSLTQNAKFYAVLGEWAQRTGQDAERLKRRVKRHMGACVKLPVISPLELQAFASIARALKAMGHDGVIRMLPDEGAVVIYQSSGNWDKPTMARAIESIYLLAAEEGVTLDISTWDRTA